MEDVLDGQSSSVRRYRDAKWEAGYFLVSLLDFSVRSERDLVDIERELVNESLCTIIFVIYLNNGWR